MTQKVVIITLANAMERYLTTLDVPESDRLLVTITWKRHDTIYLSKLFIQTIYPSRLSKSNFS